MYSNRTLCIQESLEVAIVRRFLQLLLGCKGEHVTQCEAGVITSDGATANGSGQAGSEIKKALPSEYEGRHFPSYKRLAYMHENVRTATTGDRVTSSNITTTLALMVEIEWFLSSFE